MQGPNPLKLKSKHNGPTRGLVFGPTRDEVGLSMSGKRLRVEKENIGRPGGAFAGVGEIEINEKVIDHGGEQRKVQAQTATMETPTMDESGLQVGQDGEGSKRVEA